MPNLLQRQRSDRRLAFAVRTVTSLAVAVVLGLLLFITARAVPAFHVYEVRLTVDRSAVADPIFETRTLLREALAVRLSLTDQEETRKAVRLLSPGAVFELRDVLRRDPANPVTVHLPVADKVALFLDEPKAGLDVQTAGWVEALRARGDIEKSFNHRFFTNGDSREPALAGVAGGLLGSFLVLLLCFALALPVSVAAAVYLEEFAPKNRVTEGLEAVINNLAAVPSILFGLLGLAVLLGFLGVPRGSLWAGGIVLALMAMPILVIATRAALRAVPKTVREAALALGATKLQVLRHHTLPLSMPGILSGTILALAHALGETAPLLLIGMVAFITDLPRHFDSAITVLPVQIYLWADRPEPGFASLTAAAIVVLLSFTFLLNLLAIVLRHKLQKRF